LKSSSQITSTIYL